MSLARLLTDLLLNVKLADSELRHLQFSADAYELKVERVALRGMQAAPGPQGVMLEAREAELSGVTLAGPWALPPPMRAASDRAPSAAPAEATAAGAAPNPWQLEPLASAEGSLRAQIPDAHLMFDADVTIPVRGGGIDFNHATVEHVGPDSRMGVSRLGIFVDAPNGRTYLYQFDAAPLSGVTLEQRGSLFGAWTGDRGGLTLQPFVESMVRQSLLGLTRGLTEQARVLLGRTAVSGRLRLGEGRVRMPGLQAHLTSTGGDANAIEVQAEALGRGVTMAWPALSARDATLEWQGTRLSCEQAAGRLQLQLRRDAAPDFVLSLDTLALTGLQVSAAPPQLENHSTQ